MILDQPSDAVFFEFLDRASAEHLGRRLRPRWITWLEDRDHIQIVGAELRAVEGDLAALLREAEAWVDESGIRELWFQLDGRTYLLRVRRAAGAYGA